MRFAASCSTKPNLEAAITEVAEQLSEQLPDARIDLTCVFVSHDHRQRFDELIPLLLSRWPSRTVLGCSGETIICGDREYESGPAVAVWSAELPRSELAPFRFEFDSTPDGVVCAGFPESLSEQVSRVRSVLLIGEPHSSSSTSMLERLADELPGIPVVGGMASGASSPGDNCLYLGDQVFREGAVGIALMDAPNVRAIVSQGCRPIGPTYVITKSQRNAIFELGGLPALQRLQELYPTLSPREQRLVEQGLHAGLAMNEYQEEFRRGDFLVTSVMGGHRESGAILLGNLARTGQTMRFHVRDAETADEDLRQLLSEDREAHSLPLAGLLFSCNGRGTRLFSEAHHDAAAVTRTYGGIPLAGIFANGEIGPVGGRSYIHGYTASLALFES